MLSLTAPEDHRWRLITVTCAVILATTAIAFVPPGSLPYPPAGEYSDAAISHWPNAYFLRHSVLDDGRWPLWNPNRMLGQPFAANPLSKVWYPPQWLVLIIPPTLHLNLLLYLHMAWLGIGAVGWGRASRLHPLAAALIALAWGLSPKLAGHLGAGHLDIVYALAWTPWLMWAVRRAVSEASLRSGALAGGVAALLALADLRVAFYMIPVAALYALTLSLIERRPLSRSWRMWIVAIMLGLLLSAVQIVPLLAISPALTRAAITPQEAAVYSLPPARLIGLFIRVEGDFHEWVVYPGLPTLALAMTALLHGMSRRSVILWWGLALAGTLWSLGDNGPLFMPVVDNIPLAAWVRVPPRAWFVVGLGLAAAAGHGLNALIRHGMTGWGRLAAVGAVGGGAVWFGTAWALSGLIGRTQAARLAGDGLILLSTGMGIALLGLRRSPSLSPAHGRLAGGVGGALLIVTLAISLLVLDLTMIRARMLADIERKEQGILDQIADGCDYVYSPTFELIGPATAQAGVRTLHGVDPFQLEQHARLIAEAAGVPLHGYWVIAPPVPPGEVGVADFTPDVPLLRGLGVCAVVSDVPLSVAGLEEVSRVGGATLYQVAEGPERTVEVMGEDDYDPTADFIGLGITVGALVGAAAIGLARRRRPMNG